MAFLKGNCRSFFFFFFYDLSLNVHHKPIHSAVRKLLSQYSAFSDNSATGVQRCQLSKDSRGGGGGGRKKKKKRDRGKTTTVKKTKKTR